MDTTQNTTALEVGMRLKALLDAGDMGTIYGTLYSPDIVSTEAGEDAQEYRGMDAISAKNEWWEQNFETHSMAVEGPFPNGAEFGMIYTLDVTERNSGQRMQFREIAIYGVDRGQIVREKFYYTM